MITIRYYLDCRKCESGNPAPLKLVVTRNKVRALIPLGVKLYPRDWDAAGQRCADPAFDLLLQQRLSLVRAFVFGKESEGFLNGLSAVEVKNIVAAEFFDVPLSGDKEDESMFLKRFQAFRDSHKGRTWEIYDYTLSRIKAFIGEPALKRLSFEDVTVRWLKDFDVFLSQTSHSRNGRNIHFRNIRAVFNDALDDEVIACYPFRKFKLRNVATRKRSLTVEELREVFMMDVEPYAEIYRDMFKLMFMLIGINSVDLFNLRKVTGGGRIEYVRAKTHKDYSVKVEPEAMEIIERWRGKSGLLKISDRWSDHVQFRKQMNKALGQIGALRSGLGGKKGAGLFPELTGYWARHTWATIAAELDVPDAVISQALGHSAENRTTEIYIRRNQRKVDEANRRVIDWVLYGKR